MADAVTGAVRSEWPLVDQRVPTPFPGGNDARLVAYWRRNERCPVGRHLWDVVVADTADNVPFIADDDVERFRFRMRLTCVRCGLVEHMQGIEECPYPPPNGQVDPDPLRVGGLCAQQIEADARGDGFTRWAVHDDPGAPAVGVIAWGRGPRGRRYFTGRLLSWPAGATVQAPTPQACLAKLARTANTYADIDDCVGDASDGDEARVEATP